VSFRMSAVTCPLDHRDSEAFEPITCDGLEGALLGAFLLALRSFFEQLKARRFAVLEQVRLHRARRGRVNGIRESPGVSLSARFFGDDSVAAN